MACTMLCKNAIKSHSDLKQYFQTYIDECDHDFEDYSRCGCCGNHILVEPTDYVFCAIEGHPDYHPCYPVPGKLTIEVFSTEREAKACSDEKVWANVEKKFILDYKKVRFLMKKYEKAQSESADEESQ